MKSTFQKTLFIMILCWVLLSTSLLAFNFDSQSLHATYVAMELSRRTNIEFIIPTLENDLHTIIVRQTNDYIGDPYDPVIHAFDPKAYSITYVPAEPIYHETSNDATNKLIKLATGDIEFERMAIENLMDESPEDDECLSFIQCGPRSASTRPSLYFEPGTLMSLNTDFDTHRFSLANDKLDLSVLVPPSSSKDKQTTKDNEGIYPGQNPTQDTIESNDLLSPALARSLVTHVKQSDNPINDSPHETSDETLQTGDLKYFTRIMRTGVR